MGPVTVAGLLSLMPELGQIDSKAVASLAGLAPVARESGTWKGRRFIRGGRHRVRRMLYMAALTAIRHNPDYIQKYRQLREAGQGAEGGAHGDHAQDGDFGQRPAEPGSGVDTAASQAVG